MIEGITRVCTAEQAGQNRLAVQTGARAPGIKPRLQEGERPSRAQATHEFPRGGKSSSKRGGGAIKPLHAVPGKQPNVVGVESSAAAVIVLVLEAERARGRRPVCSRRGVLALGEECGPKDIGGGGYC